MKMIKEYLHVENNYLPILYLGIIAITIYFKI